MLRDGEGKVFIFLGMTPEDGECLAALAWIMGERLGPDAPHVVEALRAAMSPDPALRALHDELDARLDVRPDLAIPPSRLWWKDSRLEDLRRQARTMLRERPRDERVILLADPRLGRCLPFWAPLLREEGKVPFCLLPIRNPQSMARSLAPSLGGSLERALVVWTHHLLVAEKESRPFPRALADLDAALGAGAEHAGKSLAVFLGRSPSPGSALQMPPLVESICGTLRTLAAQDCPAPEAMEELDRLGAEFESCWRLFSPPDVLRRVQVLEERSSSLERTLQGVMESVSWRCSAPLRSAAAALRGGKRFLREGMDMGRRLRHGPRLAPLRRGIKGLVAGSPDTHSLDRRDRLGPASGHNPAPCWGPPEAVEPKYAPVSPDPVRAISEARQKPLSFPPVGQPLVSVVIPVYNKFEYTWACLRSLRENSGEIPMEVIVMDDGSSDATGELLSGMEGLRYVRNEKNLGFLASCNRGADLARGEYLVLLNNDTEVRPGWLQALLDTFRDEPDAGMVGSRFIFPDGRLLEAGGIVWRDGSACNYGRDGDPDDPRVSYRRDVDYVSGACIMLPRDFFASLGGFDTRYSPAYYEDTDLAFRVREAGRRVICQPLSEVLHYEGVTSGVDTSSGVKQFQVTNQRTFYERWKEVLASHGEPGRRHEWEKERRVGLRILVVDVCICLPDQDSGSLRMLNLIRILQQLGHKVTFFPDNGWYAEPYTSRMRGMGVEILTAEAAPDLETHLATWGGIYDVVILSRLDVARKHVDSVRRLCPGAFLCFDTVDLHFLREGREAEIRGDSAARQSAEKRREDELGVAGKADLTLVVSEAERELLAREHPRIPVSVVSNIHEVAGCRMPFADRQDILFVGGFRHTPNVDAVVFFAREIFPHVRRSLPNVRFHVVGSNPPPEIVALAGDGVEIHGFVPDLEPFLDRCRVSVAPLRWGAGVKGKINQSMSYGLPVVATTLAAEGMFLAEGEEVLVADRAEDFASAVVKLHSDPELWERLSAAGLENVRRHFSFEVAREALSSILDGLAGSRPGEQGRSIRASSHDLSVSASGERELRARLVTFFLPQFHPIPENDEWWGEGFTEWRNVTRARPLFRRHEQPRSPADLGFYDLRLPEVRRRQAELARSCGIEAFCYWHYWFGGKRLLERPFQEILESGQPDFSFCLAWANEPWSRRWDGEAHHILQPQVYGGEEDDRRHFEWLLPAFRDPRAFRVEGNPVFLVYKARELPDAARTTGLWRRLARENGLPGLHLLSIETTGSFGWDPRAAGFDAAVEFQPNWEKTVAFSDRRGRLQKILDDRRYGVWCLDYAELWPNLDGDVPDYPRYPGVCPRWDNTPRKGRAGLVFRNSTPEEYGRWLSSAIGKVGSQPSDRRLVFINAWNEWAEGNYLEPDQTWGHAYLDATRRAVMGEGDDSDHS